MESWFTAGYARLVHGTFEAMGRDFTVVVTFITPDGWKKLDNSKTDSWAIGGDFERNEHKGWDLYARVLGLEVTVIRQNDE